MDIYRLIGDPVGLRKEIVPEIVSLMVMRFSLYKDSVFFPSHTTEYRSFFHFEEEISPRHDQYSMKAPVSDAKTYCFR